VGGTPALAQDGIHTLFDKFAVDGGPADHDNHDPDVPGRSARVVLPIKAAVMSALTLGSTMGVLTWMFVDGHGSGLMNYTPQPLMAR